MRSAVLLALLAATTAAAVLCVSAHNTPHVLSQIHVENIVQSLSATASITIHSSQFKGEGETVEVSWDGIDVTTDTDHWIGLWSPRPANDDFTKTAPAKFLKLGDAPKSSGSHQFWFLNQRDGWVAAYLTHGMDTPKLVALSEDVHFEKENIALQIHHAYTKKQDEMRFTWNSKNGQEANPVIEWGPEEAKLNYTVNATSHTYTASDFCGAPGSTVGWIAPGWFHTVVVSGLQPNTRYWYRVRDDTAGSESEVFPFWSAPVVGASTEVDLFMFGDLGQTEEDGTNEHTQMPHSLETTRSMTDDMNDGTIDLGRSSAVFHIGDVSYARGYESMWEQYFYQIKNISRHMPWMTINGQTLNTLCHERDFPDSGSLYGGHDSGGECGVAYEARYPMPTPTSGSSKGHVRDDVTWWGMDYGSIHFTMMSTEHAFAPGSPQYEFIKSDLEKVDRQKTPFLVLAGHRPMYIQNAGPTEPQAAQIRKALEPLMRAHAVDLAFWGHHHSYQRTCAVYDEVCGDENQGTGSIHIVTGAPGAGLSGVGDSKPVWMRFIEADYHGYNRVKVRDHKLTVDFVRSSDRKVMDSVTIDSKFTGGAHADSHSHKHKPAHHKPDHKHKPEHKKPEHAPALKPTPHNKPTKPRHSKHPKIVLV